METWSHRAHPACGCGNGTQWIPQSAASSVPLFRHFVVQSLNQCLPLCDPMDCSLPGSSVHGILQARILESVAISFSKGSSQPRDWTHVSCNTGRFFTTESSGTIYLIYASVCSWGFSSGSVVKNLPANAGETEDASLIPGSGRYPG